MPKDCSKRCRENPLQYEGIRHLFVRCKEASFEANMGGTTKTGFSSRQVFYRGERLYYFLALFIRANWRE